MNSSGHKHQRYIKNFLINPQFQLKYVFWMVSTGAALAFTYSILFYNFANDTYKLIIEISKVPIETQAIMHYQLTKIILLQGVITFFFLCCIGMIGLLFSHRVAGPLYKLKSAFERVKKGEGQLRIYFRKYDEFQEVALEFNKMLDQIQGREVTRPTNEKPEALTPKP